MDRICVECKTHFEGNKTSKYCSNMCRYVHKGIINKDNVYTCLNCNKKFSSTIKKDFCNKSCKKEYDKKHTIYTRICKHCSNIYTTNNKCQLFCSNDCKIDYISYTHTCIYCNSQFKSTSKRKKYCSIECKKIKQRNTYTKQTKNNQDNYSSHFTLPRCSVGEKKLYDLLTYLFVNDEIIYRERHDFLSNPETGLPLELDIYIPTLNIAFEYDGEQHYKYFKFIHGNEMNFIKMQNRDNFKKDRCKELGITLIRIRQSKEYINIGTIINKIKDNGRYDLIEYLEL